MPFAPKGLLRLTGRSDMPGPEPSPQLVALVVNDDAASRYVTARILARAGYRVREAETGMEGLAAARELPDVIVLDVKLPDVDGFEVCRRLKADAVTASIPVLQTSAAYVTAERRAEGLDSGADGYLVQPFEAIELVATLAALLRARRAEDSTRRLAADWHTTFDAIGDGVCLLDREGSVRRCNRAMAAILGSTPAALAGTSGAIERVFGAEAMGVVKARGERHVSDASVGGRWYRLVVDPVRDRDGRLEGMVVVAADTTDRHALEDELRTRAGALAEADRRKDEFLAMLAHELRNPLSAIGAALALQEAVAGGAEEGARVGETLRRQTRHLTRLVDDLLDVSRITRGKIELRRSVVDIAEVVRRAVAAAGPLVQSCRTRLQVTLPDEQVPVEGDVLRLEQVIVNLVGNAAKFSPPDSVVEVALAGRQDPPEAVLTVTDHGVGIPADMLKSIFDLFVQVDQSAARTRGGLGIGLTMVKKLVELHGGTVTAESAGEGQGATFTIRIPGAVSAIASPREKPVARSAASPRRVLLVEDNEDISELIQMQLRMWGHEVAVASDGPSGLEAALGQRPDIAFVDVGLPGMDGYEVARRIRRAQSGERMCLVAMTGYGRPEDRDRALAAGFDAHLVKPVDPRQLQQVLDSEALLRG
jgi:PAS domain S-box-containing protein